MSFLVMAEEQRGSAISRLHMGWTGCMWNQRLALLESALTYLRPACNKRDAPQEPTMPLNSHNTAQLRSIIPCMTSGETFYILINRDQCPYMDIYRGFEEQHADIGSDRFDLLQCTKSTGHLTSVLVQLLLWFSKPVWHVNCWRLMI